MLQAWALSVCPERFLSIACPHTQDWDIANCAFSLVAPLVDRLEVKTRLPALALPCVKAIRDDRAAVCRKLNLPPHMGKEVLTCALHGGDVPEDDVAVADSFLTKLRAEARALRWLAVSLLPEQYHTFCSDTTLLWPEATTFHYMWTAAEDMCLSAWIDYVRSLPVQRLSLHFDGIRVDKFSVPDPERFVKESVAAIEHHAGFRVDISLKEHLTLLESIQRCAYRTETVDDQLDVLLLAGNCIPAALCNLCPELRGDIIAWLAVGDAANRAAMKHRARTYRD